MVSKATGEKCLKTSFWDRPNRPTVWLIRPRLRTQLWSPEGHLWSRQRMVPGLMCSRSDMERTENGPIGRRGPRGQVRRWRGVIPYSRATTFSASAILAYRKISSPLKTCKCIACVVRTDAQIISNGFPEVCFRQGCKTLASSPGTSRKQLDDGKSHPTPAHANFLRVMYSSLRTFGEKRCCNSQFHLLI